MLTLSPNPQWSEKGVTVAAGNGCDDDTNKLYYQHRLHIDHDNQSIVIADYGNHRIIEWKMGASHGKVIAGGRGQGNRLDQLNYPLDVLIDKETNSPLITDGGNQRVFRWCRHQRTTEGEVMVNNIGYGRLVMDDQR